MKSEVPAVDYVKNWLGSWPRILEQAGLKLVSERHRRMLEQREQKKQEESPAKSDSEFP